METIYDYIIIGSGFGGSVAAMRLAQKGYRVGVIEAGKRWRADDFPKTNWDLKNFLWMPHLGCYGIWRLNMLKDVFILSGSGVGGGSLNYANTLYIPPESFFRKKTIQAMGGRESLLPYYQLARKMLGVCQNVRLTPQDHLLRETAELFGRGHTFTETPVGVYFGQEGKKASDPYFSGEGPDRIGCEFCGACMTGCPRDAKNTLDKNYLFFAEKFGATIIPEHKVTEILPLSQDGSDGYRISAVRTTGLFGGLRRMTFETRGVVLAAGTLGTLSLLTRLKENGTLPNLSDSLGSRVRTNSETLIGVESRKKDADFSRGVAITSSIYVDESTHIEPVRFSSGNDAMSLLTGPLTDGGGMVPRWMKFIGRILAHPVDALKTFSPAGWAKRSIILLVMQTHDNHLHVQRKRRILWPFSKGLTSRQASVNKNPTYIPIANEFARRLGKKINGIPTSSITESLINAPVTAHIMGGCAMGTNGVINDRNQVAGYVNMLITDGSQIPENLGVNPSLSITAFAERAISFIPPKPGCGIRFLKAEKEWGMTELLLQKGSREEIRLTDARQPQNCGSGNGIG